ncbi:MAG: hypothetical protein ABJB47_22065, partial [Actinomycetota bacterium]
RGTVQLFCWCPHGPPVRDRLRAATALGSISVGWMFFADEMPDRDELSAAVLEVAGEIAG